MTDRSDPASWTRELGDDVEAFATEYLRAHLFPRIAEIEQKLVGPYLEVETGSTLSIDDRYLGKWRGGALHRMAINAAVDATSTVQAVVGEAHVVPMTALYPVLRVAIENAALALHLLNPEERDTRLLRSFQAWADDASKQKQFRIAAGVEEAEAEGLRQKELAAIDALLRARTGLDSYSAAEFKLPTYTDLVARADSYLADDPAHQSEARYTHAALWRLLSGLSHGRAWAMVEVLERSDPIVNGAAGSAWLRTTSSVAGLVVILRSALDLIESTLRLYGRRSKAAWALPADAEEGKF